ncbi:MAG: 3-hydroxyacyl-CoA dehydrogenase NAD-binding domain-containing protein [Planctomycetota bacterium]|jgi:enoyl-CoA hydratase/3-hydroxyacyl-CoA dehydrogenase|nr:3-hydroxyacyl-CoA dehydrogenase NAD-binding domain-containing protein [Planctomycetota bacterium]MDP6988681.1 3-hydroxyacyl-CoA dehydrogenase NAD-binding domain-containing protein [Planctomycetota bacterium]
MSNQNPLLVPPAGTPPRKIAVVGAGTIGPDIGYYLVSALAELELLLVDIDGGQLERAGARIVANAAKGVARGKLSAEAAESIEGRVRTSTDYSAMADCDWVIEAATEDLELKRRIFGAIEAVVRPDAWITSNTSSLPAERLFCGLEHPERATVTHFFAPAFQNPAVEVVAAQACDPRVVEALRSLFAATGKVPLVTADALCFMLDRVFDNWCNEAAYLLDRATAAEVDSVAGELVHAGPFFVLNLAHGNPIIVETNTLQMEEEGEAYRPAPIFTSVETWSTGPPGGTVDVEPDTAAAIRDRLLGILFSQSVDIVDREIGGAADLDLGCKLALGFRRGPFELMEELGDEEVTRILARLRAERGALPMPSRAPTEYRDFRRHLLVDDVDGVKVITLRRPQAMNALDDTLTDELLGVIVEHEEDPAVAGFVLIGYGPRAFCAGADIGRFPALLGDAEAAAEFARDCSRLLVHLDGMSKPVVAALNGMALGGGLELALRCHSIVAQPEAWLQFPEVTLGIAPGIGALVVPYRRWPDAAPRFHEMLRAARKLGAVQARELGVLDGLAADYPDLVRLAVTRVHELAGKVEPIPEAALDLPPFAPFAPANDAERGLCGEVIAIIERAVRDAAAAPSLAEALEVGYLAFGASACTEAARERIHAFLGAGR